MASILGMRGTGNWGTDERPKSFRETILWTKPNGSAPLLALTSKIGESAVSDPEFSWWEELLDATKVAVSGTYDTDDTAIVVDSGALALVAGDVLQVAKADAATYDNEIVKVVQDPTTDVGIVISRGYAGSTAAAIADDTILVKIGSAFPEGSESPTASNRNPTKLSNFTQIFKTTYDITRTAANTDLRTGDPLVNDRKRKMHDHAVAMEYAMLLGKKSEVLGANGKPERTMAGLLSFISTNRTVFSGQGNSAGQWGYQNLMTALSNVFLFDSDSGDSRLLLMGNAAQLALNFLIINQTGSAIQWNGVVKVYGMALRELITPNGTFYIKTHPLMTRHPQLTKAAIAVDLTNIKYRPLKGSDTKHQDNIQLPDADEKKGQWITEASMEVHHEETMAYLGNFGG